MRFVIAAAVSVTGVALLAGCTTMTKEQCLVGAWGEKGYEDGLSGYRPSRLDETQPKISALREQISRSVIRAPSSGRVVGLDVPLRISSTRS